MALLYGTTLGAFVEAWSESRTYAHGFLVIPGTLYLLWCYRDRIAPPAPGPRAWILAAAPAGMWMAGHQHDNLTLQQIAVLSMAPCLVYSIWGHAVFRRLLLPLGFLGFALPIGASVEPWLQEITTRFLTFGLQAAGIPFHHEGYVITIPSGRWEVAPDCGGLRYLLPGLALGYLYAAVVYRQTLPRVFFLALCALLLMLANGLRAYGILVGDYLGVADGTDHRVFSYLVYGVTIILLAWLGHRWFPQAQVQAVPEPDACCSRPPLLRAAVMNTAGAVVLLALAPLIAWLVAPASPAGTAAGKRVLAHGEKPAENVSVDVPRP